MAEEKSTRYDYDCSLEGAFHGSVNTGQLWQEIGNAGFSDINNVYVTLAEGVITVSFPYELDGTEQATLNGICYNHHPIVKAGVSDVTTIAYTATPGPRMAMTLTVENVNPGDTGSVKVPLYFDGTLDDYWAMAAAENVGDDFSLDLLPSATAEVGELDQNLAAGSSVVAPSPSAFAAAVSGKSISVNGDAMGIVVSRDVAAVPPTVTCSKPCTMMHATGEKVYVGTRLVDNFRIGTTGMLRFAVGSATRQAFNAASYARIVYTNNAVSGDPRTFTVALEWSANVV